MVGDWYSEGRPHSEEYQGGCWMSCLHRVWHLCFVSWPNPFAPPCTFLCCTHLVNCRCPQWGLPTNPLPFPYLRLPKQHTDHHPGKRLDRTCVSLVSHFQRNVCSVPAQT